MERLKSNMRENCGIEPNVSLSVHVSEKSHYCYDMVIHCNCQLINQRQHPESLIFGACTKMENHKCIYQPELDGHIFVPYLWSLTWAHRHWKVNVLYCIFSCLFIALYVTFTGFLIILIWILEPFTCLKNLIQTFERCYFVESRVQAYYRLITSQRVHLLTYVWQCYDI